MTWTREFWLFQILNGLAFGSLLFLLASGFSLIMGLMRIINLAHGTTYLLGAYIGIDVQRRTGSFWLAILAAAGAMAVLGVLLERVILHRFHRQELVQVLITIGFSLFFADLILVIWGSAPALILPPDWLQPSIVVWGVFFPKYRLFIIAVAVVVGIGLLLFERKTRVGAIVRAGVDDEEMVRGMGVNIDRVFFLMFGLGALLAGGAGVIGGPFLGAEPGLDNNVLLWALVVVIIGGVGSIGGAAVGAVVTGIVWNVSNAVWPDFAYFTLFAPLVVFMAFRPQGLFGRA